jgi:radical SAM superfamily enzyme YgiQ (UPF0313 family)
VRNYDSHNSHKKIPPVNGLIFGGEDPESLKERWIVERLEDYPYMDYALFDSEGGKKLSQRCLGSLSAGGIFSLPVITGRGCPYRCTYCSNSALLDFYGGAKKFLRRYSPDSVMAHIKSSSNLYRPQMLDFLDETFTQNRQWVRDFCSLYNKEVGLPFAIMSRIDTIDEDTISTMADSGLAVVYIGIESGDEEYRMSYLNRRMSNKIIKEGVAHLKKKGIIVVTFNILGMPFETKETIKNTFALNEEIEPDVAASFIYQPLPGTELATLAYEHSIAFSPHEDTWDFASPALDTAELPASYVSEMAGKFRERFANQNIVQDVYGRLRKLIT